MSCSLHNYSLLKSIFYNNTPVCILFGIYYDMLYMFFRIEQKVSRLWSCISYSWTVACFL